jgi:probable rRNA maturation factor
MKHQISVHSEVPHGNTPALTAHIRRCIQGALDQEGITVPCEVDVLLTDNAGIREINRDYRDVDRETDVLSFPMFEFVPGQFPEDVSNLLDPGSDLLPLGDMALSLEKIQAQAQEFGHSQEREIGYLTVHSVLHLLGYDHLDEGEMKRQMREREEAIMAYLNIPR